MNYLYDLATDKKKGAGPAVIKAFLFVLSLLYCLAVRILSSFYGFAPYKLNCKVISVGNITLGGTGKTTLVEFIARYLKKEGHKVAIISRGYKRRQVMNDACLPQGQELNCETMGDEPYMLSKNLEGVPVIVDRDRARAANLAINEYGVDTVILDDGFQQWRISKDLEIVAIDATNPFGNRQLIPRGLLREPLSSLRRAGMFVLTKTNLVPDTAATKGFLAKLAPDTQVFESAHIPEGFYDICKPKELLSTDILKSKPVALVCGIGDPDSFENLVRSQGVIIGASFRFPDHHYYANKDLDRVIRDSKGRGIDTIITTEKDAARLSRLAPTGYGLRILALRISLSIINDEQKFYSRLLKLYSF